MALGKTIAAMPLESKMVSSSHLSRIGATSGISRRPQIPNRNCLSRLDIESCSGLVSTFVREGLFLLALARAISIVRRLGALSPLDQYPPPGGYSRCPSCPVERPLG